MTRNFGESLASRREDRGAKVWLWRVSPTGLTHMLKVQNPRNSGIIAGFALRCVGSLPHREPATILGVRNEVMKLHAFPDSETIRGLSPGSGVESPPSLKGHNRRECLVSGSIWRHCDSRWLCLPRKSHRAADASYFAPWSIHARSKPTCWAFKGFGGGPNPPGPPPGPPPPGLGPPGPCSPGAPGGG